MQKISALTVDAMCISGYKDVRAIYLVIGMIDYKEELKEIERKMIESAKFAERLPVFADVIMRNKLNGSEQWVKFGDRYKDIYLGWGIARGYFERGKSREITNCRDEYSGYFFCIYVNTLSLYDLHDKFDLDDALKNVDVFFKDELNSTFYVTDENIEAFLDALNTWYLKARDEAKIVHWQQRLDAAKDDVVKFTKLIEEGLKSMVKNEN